MKKGDIPNNGPLGSIRRQLHGVSPYKPGMSIEELARKYSIPEERIVKLASNENPFGMSPSAEQAICVAANDSYRYPDQYTLGVAIAAHWGVAGTSIVLGNGSNDIIDLVARTFLGAGDEAVSSEYAFGIYQLVTKLVGAINCVVPAANFGHDLDAMENAITPHTKVVWIANPNNPTGTMISHDVVEQFIIRLPKHIIVVLDEAYIEYLRDEQRADTAHWPEKYPNLVILRTFSKAYGLAGLRVGYAIASPEIANMLNRVRQPFNVNRVAIAAAIASLEDQDFVKMARDRNNSALQQLTGGFDELHLFYLPPNANFVTVRFDDAPKVCESLLKKGIIVRPLIEYGMPNYLRISCGRPEENDQLLQALEEILNNHQ